MKICHLSINNYKQFKSLNLNLTYPLGHKKEGQPLDKVCIIGQSGTGKTNILDIIKKSVIDFSLNSSYHPFNEFTNKKNDDKFIKSEFISKSKINAKVLFTEDDSKIEFNNDNNKIIEEYEKSYFVGTKDYSIFNREDDIEYQEDKKEQISPIDKFILKKLTDTKDGFLLEDLSNELPTTEMIDNEINKIKSKYLKKDNINKSLNFRTC